MNINALRSSAAGQPEIRCCDWPGCEGVGEHRAPMSRDDLRSYHWFCLDHVRQYNAGWNYYAGMTDAEVEADLRRDTVWNRPSWPLGGGRRGNGANGDFRYTTDDLLDRLGAFGPEWDATAADGRPDGSAPLATRQAWAVAVFGLGGPVRAEAVKARYKELVKQHHPDINGGDKAAEEKIKEINEAYQIILDMLAP
ncbi:MAG: J domain-containing protein [Rhodospirillales bacterium]